MGKKILLVDDEAELVEMIKMRLEASGYVVLTAYNGKQALEKVQEAPDLILLDILMPEMDGIEVAIKLKSSDKTKSIPIVMLTAKSQMEDLTKAADIGVTDYIVKPFDPQIMLKKIKNILS